jgi:hypothetical protein
LLPAVLLTFTSCSSAPKVEKTTTTAYRQSVPGGTLVETYKITALVKAIDPADRKVTLVASDGSANTFTAGPKNRAFDQLRAGEQVQAAVTRELVVFLRKDGAPLTDNTLLSTAVNSGALKSDTVQLIAQVGIVDRKRRQVALQFPDGTSKSFTTRKDVDLQRVQSGEEVVIRTTSAVVLTLEKQ